VQCSLAHSLLQAVGKYEHSYIGYDALLAELQADGGTGAPHRSTLLQWLAEHTDGSAPSPVPASPFAHAFIGEVERVRVFVKGGLEQLWLALHGECAALRAMSEELLQVRELAAGTDPTMAAPAASLTARIDCATWHVPCREGAWLGGALGSWAGGWPGRVPPWTGRRRRSCCWSASCAKTPPPARSWRRWVVREGHGAAVCAVVFVQGAAGWRSLVELLMPAHPAHAGFASRMPAGRV
jgi:hypothetical protein